MKSQLYLHEVRREYLKSELISYAKVFFDKLLPVFKDIEAEADERAEDYYHSVMSQPAGEDYILDAADIAEQAQEKGIEHYSFLKLGKYNLIAMWHATLYHFWEQQVRLFLFNEMSHTDKIVFADFCTKINKIKEKFIFHNFNIESLPCWVKINELRLLCNVIKHSDLQVANHA
jgi:hypothetical protein